MGKATKGTTARKQAKAATRWLDYQPLFGKGACAPPPNSLLGEGRPDTRERQISSLGYAGNTS